MYKKKILNGKILCTPFLCEKSKRNITFLTDVAVARVCMCVLFILSVPDFYPDDALSR